MARTIDLNSDLGESTNGRIVADDAAMFALITSANVACGFHAGDESTMHSCVRLALRHGVALGAHVSYRDRDGFGRRPVEIAAAALIADLLEQLAALAAIAVDEGARIRYVKPHGALYNRIVTDDAQADAVATAVRAADPTLAILGLADSAISAAAETRGLAFHREAFADRGYRPDGTLVPRAEPGAVLTNVEVIAARAVRMVTAGEVDAANGSPISLRADSLCVHGDTPGAVTMARAVRAALKTAGVRLAAFA